MEGRGGEGMRWVWGIERLGKGVCVKGTNDRGNVGGVVVLCVSRLRTTCALLCPSLSLCACACADCCDEGEESGWVDVWPLWQRAGAISLFLCGTGQGPLAPHDRLLHGYARVIRAVPAHEESNRILILQLLFCLYACLYI